MSRADRERWNRKYAAGNPHAAFAPSPLLEQYAPLLDGAGLALDLACGVGQNAIFLAERGYHVLGVDISFRGLAYARTEIAARSLDNVLLVAADLERFVLPEAAFAVAIVFRYLDRSLFPRLKQTVAPGGLVFYETFNANQLHAAPQMNRAYLLEQGELAHAFEDFATIATNDTADNTSELTHWIGRRPAS